MRLFLYRKGNIFIIYIQIIEQKNILDKNKNPNFSYNIK